ncbi:restriction endonuclease subunit S [Synechococcus sp. UW140]|uniref:restriction endonuclease subunit S n=1 Tax=Synechococcus sp. UW140 TaxID=368503 RepID=UPI00313772DA
MKNDWQTKNLGDLCRVRTGRKDVNEGNPDGEFPFFTCAAEHTFSDNYSFDTEALLIAGNGDVGKVSYYNGKFEAYQRTYVLSDFIDVLPRFLFLILDGKLKETVSKQKLGNTMPYIKVGMLTDFHLPVPPLAEQQRIVGLLDEAFKGIATAKANAERNLQNARALFESHLQSVFTQRSPGWVEKRLGEVGKVSMCKRIFKEETTTTGDIPFYKIGTFGKEPDAFIPIQIYNEYRTKYSFPKKGDVLISASGTIGRRVRYDGEPAYFQDSNIVWIDNDEERVLNDFLYHFYGACKWNSTKGATISRLYNDNLRGIVIAFPESHQEQRLIVTQLDDLREETQRLARLYERKLSALEALKRSLLHQAFTGEL